MKKEKRYLVPEDYMADPAVHVFNDRLYIYPSHDWESGIPENDNGDHFNMKDYHVFSTDDPMHGEITDHGLVLTTEDIPWAGRQLWDCDVAEKDGKYYMYFPLKDQNDIFRIGVAISDRPEGPFIPQPDPMRGSYSIDPAVLNDGDGNYYMYFGGADNCNVTVTTRLWKAVLLSPQTMNRPSPHALPSSVRTCCNLPKNPKP